MSIRPVDHQVTVSKSGDISRLHFQDNQKALVSQQSQNNTLKSSAEARIKQVRSREEIQKVRMQEREKQEGQQDRNQEGKKRENKQSMIHNRKDEHDNYTGKSIDIRL